MYIVKFQQMFPEGDWLNYRGSDGVSMAFGTQDEAMKCVDRLTSDPRNRGLRFKAFPANCVDPDVQAAIDRQQFQV